MKRLILILTVMLSVGCEDTLDNRIDHLETAMKGLRYENCALTNKIYQQEYDSCVALVKATTGLNQDEYKNKVGKEIERLAKLINQDMKDSISIIPSIKGSLRMYSESQCYKRFPQNCEVN